MLQNSNGFNALVHTSFDVVASMDPIEASLIASGNLKNLFLMHRKPGEDGQSRYVAMYMMYARALSIV